MSEALKIAIKSLELIANVNAMDYEYQKEAKDALKSIKAALEAKDEPYAFEASMYPRVIIDPVTGNVSIGTVTKPCGLECDCTDVCEQETDYKALWQQMCERCDELDKKLAQQEHEPVVFNTLASLKHKKTVGPIESAMSNITPPQRTWVGLTDEEMKTVVEQELVNYWDGEYIDTTGARDCLTKFARAIEAAHGIKGEAK